MNFSVLDWTIFVSLFILLTGMSFFLKKFAKGVAGFLVAGRNVGRYLGLESDSMAGLGAVTILAMWQMNYNSGFVGLLWYLLIPSVSALVALTGFAIYRFRQTRVMTLGQFVEMRYSKSARILFGGIAFTAGVLNMGVFPAAGAHFFVNYCGLPDKIITSEPFPMFAGFVFPGLEISLMATLLMLVLVAAAVIICFNGGQVTLVVTNFVQALFVNVMLVTIMFSIYKMFTWDQFTEAYLSATDADGKSISETLLHPFSSGQVEGFDKAFFMIGIFAMVYWVISWAPNSLVTSSASGAHEAKMMRVMVEIKKLVYVGLGIGVLPLAVFVLMNHPTAFTEEAAAVQKIVDQIPNKQISSQMLTPAALQFIMPRGILGAFAGFVLFAFLSTHTSYLLAWGGGLIQDVIIPVRGKSLEPKKHMKFIRVSVLCVAVYIVLFSTFFKQNDNLYMFLDLTGGIYLSTAVVLLGGLYWKKGTTLGAWAAMLAGAVVSIIGLVIKCGFNDEEGVNTVFDVHGYMITLYSFIGFCIALTLFGLLSLRRKAFTGSIVSIVLGVVLGSLCYKYRANVNPEFTGRLIMFHASLISIAVYLLLSELTKSDSVSFDEMFNRSAEEIELRKQRRWWQFAPEVPKLDRILIPCIYGGIFAFIASFIGAWIYCTKNEVSSEAWLKFWHVYIYTMFGFGVVFMIWVILGGFRDLIRMFKNLMTQKTDAADDGSVQGHHAASGANQDSPSPKGR
jgi:SSS family solute:Na+ symporter